MVPKTVASWVCDHAHAETEANNMASMHDLYEDRFVLVRMLLRC